MKVSWTNVAAVIAAVAITASLVEPEVVTIRDVITDTVIVSPATFAAEERQLAPKGAPIAPRVIVRTDTLVSPPDTVVQILRIDAAGGVAVSTLVQEDSLWTPELHYFQPPRNCDDGLGWSNGSIICDTARFGHLHTFVELYGVYPSLSLQPKLGIYWEPSYRSVWRVGGGISTNGAFVGVSRGYRLF